MVQQQLHIQMYELSVEIQWAMKREKQTNSLKLLKQLCKYCLWFYWREWPLNELNESIPCIIDEYWLNAMCNCEFSRS